MKTKTQLNTVETISRRAALEEVNAVAGILLSAGTVKCTHTPQERFTRGGAFEVKLFVSGVSSGEGINSVRSVRLRYRHVNQAERWNALDLDGENGVYAAAIPPEYTGSDFALEYYFELANARGAEWMYPGFNKALSNQPYFAVCKRNA